MGCGHHTSDDGRGDDREGDGDQERRSAHERGQRLAASPPVGRVHRSTCLVCVHSSPSQRCPTPSEATIVLRSWSEGQIPDNSLGGSVVISRYRPHFWVLCPFDTEGGSECLGA